MGAEPVPGAMQVEGSQGPGLVVAEAQELPMPAPGLVVAEAQELPMPGPGLVVAVVQELHWKAVQLGRTRLPQLPERYRSNAPRLLPFVCYLKQLGLRSRYLELLLTGNTA